ncbi:MAG TPA: carboxypeptidase-like regulatory domain-containing protein [Candidatus Thermoplasmatota archaeon]|nr:carboxypeptidase-like regulatory domain-containing protein [Candidatus Thermoplasmatota archaeon]
MRGLGFGRAKKEATPPEPAPPLARPPSVAHHWLTISVARPGPAAPLPVSHARVVIRPFPRGASKPEEAVARGATGPDGSIAVSLPAGRYAVYAQHEGEGKAVTVTLEHAGRAMLTLESLGRRVILSCEVTGPDGDPVPDATVDVRTVPAGTHAAREVTNDDGVADVHLPPGAYEVRVGDTITRTYIEADTILRIMAERQAPEAVAAPPVSKYAQRARAATSVIAPLDTGAVREETWN